MVHSQWEAYMVWVRNRSDGGRQQPQNLQAISKFCIWSNKADRLQILFGLNNLIIISGMVLILNFKKNVATAVQAARLNETILAGIGSKLNGHFKQFNLLKI